MKQQKNKKKLNIAILSPNKDVYSETFIRAHKENIDGNIFYYYDGYIPNKLENYGELSFEDTGEELYDLASQDEVFKRLYNLYKSFEMNKIDVVIAEYGVTAAESLIAIQSLGIPLITHFHGFDASVNSVVQKYHKKYEEVFLYSDKVIVVSRKMEYMLIDLGCEKEKIVYAPCGPDDTFFDIIPTFKSKQFLAVGRFVNKKAPYYTVLAFKEVLKKYPDAKLKMLAKGPYFDICKNIVKNCEMKDNIIFAGSVSHDVVIKEMGSSIAFVQHSITADNGDMEGTPVAVMEAGAAGLPVVATNHAGIPDVVISGKTGLLVDEHDVCGMANAMGSILEDIESSKKMGANARKRIQQYFTLKTNIKEINNTVQGCIKKKENIDLFFIEMNNDLQYQIRAKDDIIKGKDKEITKIRKSKTFKLGNLFYRSIKRPYKLIMFPINFIKILRK